MKKILKGCLVLAFCLVTILAFSRQVENPAPQMGWIPLGPPGGSVAAMAFHPEDRSRIYAVMEGQPSQLFLSEDSGETWSRVAVLSDAAYDIALDPWNPNNIYVLGTEAVLKSSNAGESWSSIALGSDASGEGGEILVHPLDADTVYASGSCVFDTFLGRSCAAFFKSADAGATWEVTPINPTVRQGFGSCLDVNPLDADEIFVGGSETPTSQTSGKVYRSLDGGVTWGEVADFYSSVECLVIDPAHPFRLYAGTGWAVYRSLDGGNSWVGNIGQAFARSLALDPLNSEVLYGGWDNIVYKSTDGGVNWDRCYTDQAGRGTSILAEGNRIYLGTDKGFYKSLNAGLNWQESCDGLHASSVDALALSPSSPGIVYLKANSILWKSLDHGKSWTRLPYFLFAPNIEEFIVHADNPDHLYAIAKGCGG